MMRKLYLMLFAAFAIIATVSCSDKIIEEVIGDPAPEVSTIQEPTIIHVSVGAGTGGAQTKSAVAYDGDAKTRTLKFTEGDCLYIDRDLADDKNLAGTLTMKDGSLSDDGLSAQFEGTLKVYASDGSETSYDFDSEDPLKGSTAFLLHKDMVAGLYTYETDKSPAYHQDQLVAAADVQTLMTTMLLVSGSYTEGTGYSLSTAATPILNCNFSGLTASTEYWFVLKKDGSEAKNVKWTSDGIGTAAFAFASLVSGNHAWTLDIKQEGNTVGTIDFGTREFTSKVYNVSRRFEIDKLSTPLTFEAKEAGAKVSFKKGDGVDVTLEYSKNDADWSEYTSEEVIILESVGDKVSFRAEKTTNGGITNSNFSCTQDCYIYGNIMSLLSKDGFVTATSVPDYAFERLFDGNDHILSHPSKELILPATTLAVCCYFFMFHDCKALTTAPALPATTLAEGCYASMFEGCTGLTTAPALPAPTLVEGCYYFMFSGCSSLNSVTCLATDISARDCTGDWLDGVATSGTFTKAPSMSDWTSGNSGIPSGWTTLVNLASLTADYTAQNGDVLTGTLTGNYQISIANGAKVTLDGVTINGTDYSGWAGLTCNGDATIVLADGSENTVKGCRYFPGIYVPSGNTLTIQGSTGKLDASSNGNGAGIGGGYIHEGDITSGNILISGGIITATGGSETAGIGGGYATGTNTCGTITITGGTVTAYGGNNAAGIGGAASCGKITITGGTVTAMGGENGAGIGCSKDGSCTNGIEISGTADVTATGGEFGAGIGSAYAVSRNSTCGNILIGGTATVKATGGEYAAGIGSGRGYNISSQSICGTITIKGTVTSVIATKGNPAPNSIGKGTFNSTCGGVFIEDESKVTKN